jgi:Asp-tRNA(Asn)/Glu-tRNA(Gln) amidotransferase A subunit family amidase
VAVPAGFRENGLPFGVTLIGAAWTGKLSAIAQQFLGEVEREATSLRKSRIAAI